MVIGPISFKALSSPPSDTHYMIKYYNTGEPAKNYLMELNYKKPLHFNLKINNKIEKCFTNGAINCITHGVCM